MLLCLCREFEHERSMHRLMGVMLLLLTSVVSYATNSRFHCRCKGKRRRTAEELSRGKHSHSGPCFRAARVAEKESRGYPLSPRTCNFQGLRSYVKSVPTEWEVWDP